ncbi:MAG: hypothetical protein AUG00_04070 [Candidatus Rokubacteria bacterium 13_1_20CM_2_70_7]|nr:MAG: hypothetical protein AUG00_04070 [Candidatus Rokubacteria bacterium 13_1_20CM_2_70_7]
MPALVSRQPSTIVHSRLRTFDPLIAVGLEVRSAVEHILVQVSEDETPAAQAGAVGHQRVIVEVILDSLLEEVGFADEQVGAGRRLHQRLRPLGVAGIDDDFAAVLDAQGVGGGPAGVGHLERGDGGRADDRGASIDQLQELDGEAAGHAGRAGEEDLHGRLEAGGYAGRTRDLERTRSPPELPVEDQEGQAAEMVAVQMREHDPLDGVRIEAGALHGDERRSAAVDQDAPAVSAAQVQTGLEPPATAERVTRSKKLKLDGGHHPERAGLRPPTASSPRRARRPPLDERVAVEGSCRHGVSFPPAESSAPYSTPYR